MTTRVDYRNELRRYRDALADLLSQREELEIRIARLKRKVAAFAELCDESDFAEQGIDLELGGLTDVCRTAMRASRKEWMTIADIEKIVGDLGFPLDQYKAATASITTTVNRLVESGEVGTDRHIDKPVRYKWVGKRPRGEIKARGLRVGKFGDPPVSEEI